MNAKEFNEQSDSDKEQGRREAILIGNRWEGEFLIALSQLGFFYIESYFYSDEEAVAQKNIALEKSDIQLDRYTL